MTADLYQPHDAMFKREFSDPEFCRDFFRSFLPKTLTAGLELRTLELQPGSYVDENLRQSQSDLLFRTGLKNGGDARVYLLFEHQSTPDADMPFRLWRYVARIWEQHRKQHPEEHPLPFVVPVVFYHGATRWQVRKRFSRVVQFWPELGMQCPELEYLVIDLGDFTDEEIKQAVWGRIPGIITLGFFKHIHDSDFIGFLRTLLPFFEELERAETGLQYIATYLNYIYSVRGDQVLEDSAEMLRRVAPQTTEVAMTTTIARARQQAREEGWAEGLEEGRVEGRVEGTLDTARKILMVQLREEFGPLPDAFEEKILEVRKPETLTALLSRFKSWESLDHVERLLDRGLAEDEKTN